MYSQLDEILKQWVIIMCSHQWYRGRIGSSEWVLDIGQFIKMITSKYLVFMKEVNEILTSVLRENW